MDIDTVTIVASVHHFRAHMRQDVRAPRQLHWHLSVMRGPCDLKRAANAASFRQYYAPASAATDKLAAG